MPDNSLPVLAFDMNGTLLDLSVLDPLFQRAFGATERRREWFMQMLQLAMATSLTGYYTDFSSLGRSALEMVAGRHGVELTDKVRETILGMVRRLPAFPDVAPGLARLKHAGYRLMVLTNSPSSSAEESLAEADLRGYFEAVLSVESVQRYKPAPEVYRLAATKLGVSPSELMLVAAHGWDTTGAIRAGCRAAFISRPGAVLDPAGPRPDILARDMEELAGRLIAAEKAA